MDLPPHHDLPASAPPVLRFDWQDWLPYLGDDDIPEAEKRALIETLWSIVLAFVDLGWSVTPTSGEPAAGADAGEAPKSRGQVVDLKAALEAAVLRSRSSETGTEGP